jgi:hypothetical protein
MPAQQRDLRENYIGLVNDKTEEQCAVESQAKPDHRVDYFAADGCRAQQPWRREAIVVSRDQKLRWARSCSETAF